MNVTVSTVTVLDLDRDRPPPCLNLHTINQSWVIGSFLIQLQLQLQLLLKIFPQLQLQLQLLDFFFNVIAITITNQLKLNYILNRVQLVNNILVFRGFYLDSIKNQVKIFIFLFNEITLKFFSYVGR